MGFTIGRIWSQLMTEVQLHDEGGVTILEFDRGLSTLDEKATQRIKADVLSASEQISSCVLVDLSTVNFFGSSFIEILFRLWHRTQQQEGQFAICGLSEYCREVLAVTNLDTLWTIYPTREEALDALTSTA